MYSRMSNLAHEFFWSIGAPNFSVITHQCPFRHKFAEMDKQELSIWRFISTAFKRPFVHLYKFVMAKI